MRAKPANDTAYPAAAVARAPAPAHDAGTSYAAPRLGAELARLLDAAMRAHGLRKCEQEPDELRVRRTQRWLSGSYTTVRVYRIAVMR
jgi:hypothetical protein